MKLIAFILIGLSTSLTIQRLFAARNSLFSLLGSPQRFLDRTSASKPNPGVMVSSKNASQTESTISPSMSLTQEQWQSFVRTHTKLLSATRFRRGSFGEAQGCGFSSKIRIAKHEKLNGSITSAQQCRSTASVYFKSVSCTSSTHEDSESHTREIKAAYLDRILGTNVVPPTVGIVMDYEAYREVIYSPKYVRDVSLAVRCMPSTSSAPQLKSLHGSAMVFLDGVTPVDRETVGRMALAYANNTQSPSLHSAMNYIVFLYLAGCIKSSHNHFQWHQHRLLAIDNDRCFSSHATLQAFQQSRPDTYEQWFGMLERVLFQSCVIPAQVRRVLDDATSGRNGTMRLSQQLRETLLTDDLAADILALQPETFLEMDERAEKLMKHLRNCSRDD
jgi:hypothetical protein